MVPSTATPRSGNPLAASHTTDDSAAEPRLQIEFVCTGNICRSPMAAVIFADALEKEQISAVHVTSSGISGWHVGQRADARALKELERAGYDGSLHRASKLVPENSSTSLFVAMDQGHRAQMLSRGIPPTKIRLMRSFDPDSPRGAEVADPYYGDAAAFRTTREEIEAAVPGLLAWVRERLQ